MKQGDPLSAMLFNVFLDGLTEELVIGIDFHNVSFVVLLYADDIVIYTNIENYLQRNN